MIRAVVDTNILIRALIKPQGSVGPIITALRSRLFTLVLSEPLLEELLATMALPRIRRKYRLTDQDTRDYVAFLSLHSLLVEPPHRVSVCRDKSDNKVLEAALAGGVDFRDQRRGPVGAGLLRGHPHRARGPVSEGPEPGTTIVRAALRNYPRPATS